MGTSVLVFFSTLTLKIEFDPIPFVEPRSKIFSTASLEGGIPESTAGVPESFHAGIPESNAGSANGRESRRESHVSGMPERESLSQTTNAESLSLQTTIAVRTALHLTVGIAI